MARYLITLTFSVEANDDEAAFDLGEEMVATMPPAPESADVTYEGCRTQLES